jgi:glycerol kinase
LAEFVASIDQGTTSTRCMIFDRDGAEVGRHQLEHEQILPRAGWVEHNPIEIWERTTSVLMSTLNATNLSSKDIVALGIDAPAGRTTTRSSGKTPAPTGSHRRWTAMAAAT